MVPGPRSTNDGGGVHGGALAPPAASRGAPPVYPPRAPPLPCANTVRDSKAPLFLGSRNTVMLLAAGELTNKSPFGAYTIIRGACSSAYTLTLNPGGTLGMTVSGLLTRLEFARLPVPGAGSRSARGCG